MIWWLIPIVATLSAYLYLRLSGSLRGRARRRPEPGSPEDRAELARLAEALERPLPSQPSSAGRS